MNDLAPSRNSPPHRGPAAPVFRTLTLALAFGMAALLVLGVDCAIYLAVVSGEPPSLAVVLQQAPRWICGLLRACSA